MILYKCLFVLCIACTTMAYDEQEMEVAVSRGVAVDLVHPVTLYTEEQYLNFFIPDLPDLPSLTSENCPEYPQSQSCSITAKLNEINHDSLHLLGLLNKMLTRSGLGIQEVVNLTAANGTQANQSSEHSGSNRVTGFDWLAVLKERLDLRSISSTNTERSGRPRRSPLPPFLGVAVKGIATAASLFGIDDLFGFFSDIFVSKDKILNIITTLMKFMPVDRESFAKVVKQVSEFEDFARKSFAEVRLDNQGLRNITEALDREIQAHRLDISVISEGYGQTQRVLGDVTTIMFTAIMYILQLQAFQTCREKHLPLLYVPPTLLQSTLAEVLESLPADTEFAIPLEKLASYYTMPGMVSCLYDDDGGIIRLRVPLKERGSVFRLYAVRPLQFRWEDQTCYLNLEASLVAKEMRTGTVYPVTNLDSSKCKPMEEKHCKVPPSNSDDVQSSCISTILGGGTTDDIKSSCLIKCSSHSVPEVSKINDGLFVATHIRANTLTIICPNENRTIGQEILYGSIKITVGCSCVLKLNGRVVGRSSKAICSDTDILTVETLLPAHFTTSQDVIHFDDSGADSLRFKHKTEIFNTDFMDQLHPEADDGILTTQINVITVVWNCIQTLLILYSFLRMNSIGALLMTVANNVPMVEAAPSHACRLPDSAYYLLVSIIILVIIGIVPQYAFICLNIFRGIFWTEVEVEAKKMTMQPDLESNAVNRVSHNTSRRGADSSDSDSEKKRHSRRYK